MKRIATVIFIVILLYGGIAHALMNCLQDGHDVHGQEHEHSGDRDADGSMAHQGVSIARIHCADAQLLGFAVSSAQQKLSKRSAQWAAPEAVSDYPAYYPDFAPEISSRSPSRPFRGDGANFPLLPVLRI